MRTLLIEGEEYPLTGPRKAPNTEPMEVPIDALVKNGGALADDPIRLPD